MANGALLPLVSNPRLHPPHTPMEEESELEFVGTLTDRFSPLRPLRIPSFVEGGSRRQEAGGGFIASNDELNRLLGVLYFLSWTRSALKSYSSDIRKLVEQPLEERCTRRTARETVTDESSASDSRLSAMRAAKRLEAGTCMVEGNPEVLKLRQQLARAVERPLDVDDEYTPVVREHCVTPVEGAALCRLATLVKMSGSWLKKTLDLETWMEKNRKALVAHAADVAPALEHAVTAFDAVCVLGEVYGLEAVDRSRVKTEFAAFLRPYVRPKTATASGRLHVPRTLHAVEYVGELKARINHHRTVVAAIGSSMLAVFQTLLRAVPVELLETTTRAVKEVADRLPPRFLFVARLPLSSFAEAVLAKAPPNSIEVVFADDDAAHDAPASDRRTLRSRSKASTAPSHPSLRSQTTQNDSFGQRTTAASVRSDRTQSAASSQKSPPTARNL